MSYFKSLLFTACALVMLAACNTDDLRDDVNDLKNRVESLEAQVALLNDNMTAIRVLLEGGKTITELTNNNGTYTLKLSNGETITLTQGMKGETAVPSITVNANGEWVVENVVLKDANGNPVLAVGANGTNGTTPKFQIATEGNLWQISYDNGATWTNVLNSEGKPVSAVGDSTGGGSVTDNFFEDVTQNDDFFMVKLKGETEYISIPIVKDILCKITVPEDALKNGFWEIGYGKTVTATVKVKGDHIITTAPTGWTVTISEPDANTNEAVLTITAPAKAETRVLSRATADNSYDVTVQANKGAAWAVDKIQVKAIDMIDSYWAVYESGASFTVNGIEVNKEKFPDAIYIEENKDITAAGIYFIKEGVTANYMGSSGIQQLILIGDKPQAVSTVNVKAQIKLIQANGEEGYFLCKNIALVGDANLKTQIFTYNTDNNPFKYVAFDQCQITPCAGSHLLYLSTNTRSIENFSMENSKFISEAANQKYIISVATSTSQEYKNVTFKNNIFYCPTGKVAQFALFGGKSGDTHAGINTKLILENNTFVNMETATTGMVYVDNIASISVKNNLFWTNTSGANACIIFRVTTPPTNEVCTENIVYKTMSFNWQMFFGGKLPFVGAEELKMAESNPFEGGTFDLANGKFVPNATYTGYGASIN